MPTLQFPTLEDRRYVHGLISLYSHGKLSRDDMMRSIAQIVEKYKLERIPVFGYSVRILQYYKDLPIISIEGAKLSDRCPACEAGTNLAKYLRTEKENLDRDYDVVSVTCLECGCVYMTKGVNGRRRPNEATF